MTFKLKFPKFLRSTKIDELKTNPSVNYSNVLYVESLIVLFETINDGTTEMLRQKVNEYLAKHDNNYEEAKKHLFADFGNQLKKQIESSGFLLQSKISKA